MPVTSFALMIFSVLAAAGLTIWALNAWGALTVLPVLMALGLLARWALAHVPYDDSHP
ncbi:hypothetical protein [Thalassococcus profundi]|uniref:hypothetical protein n=1 Tax=Thalassococcus profundi TaxID=2282382 RepID=UPI0018F26FBB|nr:hypothetical protein [Thalassococcus profundi]